MRDRTPNQQFPSVLAPLSILDIIGITSANAMPLSNPGDFRRKSPENSNLCHFTVEKPVSDR